MLRVCEGEEEGVDCGGCVLTRVEGGTSSQPLVPLLEAAEDGEEQHAVARLQRSVQELPGRHAIVAPWWPDREELTVTTKLTTATDQPAGGRQETYRRCG